MLWARVSQQSQTGLDPGLARPVTLHARPCCSVGMLFIPNDDALEAKCKAIFEAVAKAENFKVGGASGRCQLDVQQRQRQRAGWPAGCEARRAARVGHASLLRSSST